MNPAAEGIFGYSESELLGEDVKTLISEANRSGRDGYLQQYVATGTGTLIGVAGRRSDGTTFPMGLSVSEMNLGDGERSFVGVIRDMTEESRLAEEIDRFLSRMAFVRRTLARSWLDSNVANAA